MKQQEKKRNENNGEKQEMKRKMIDDFNAYHNNGIAYESMLIFFNLRHFGCLIFRCTIVMNNTNSAAQLYNDFSEIRRTK